MIIKGKEITLPPICVKVGFTLRYSHIGLSLYIAQSLHNILENVEGHPEIPSIQTTVHSVYTAKNDHRLLFQSIYTVFWLSNVFFFPTNFFSFAYILHKHNKHKNNRSSWPFWCRFVLQYNVSVIVHIFFCVCARKKLNAVEVF